MHKLRRVSGKLQKPASLIPFRTVNRTTLENAKTQLFSSTSAEVMTTPTEITSNDRV